ncbi:MAG: hypothetical protein ACRDGM_07765 [bacterium]
MTIDEVLSRLDRVRPRGLGQWSGRCPGHKDSEPSLSIREGVNGRVLFHCFAGCALAQITDALGLRVADLFGTPLNPREALALRRSRALRKAEDLAHRQQEGRQLDRLREAEQRIQRACEIDISGWRASELDVSLQTLANAYTLLEEDHEWGP